MVRVGLRHRRLGDAARDDGADARRDRARARARAGLRVDRGGRRPRQRRDGRGLRRHARADDLPLAARSPPRPAAQTGCPGVRLDDLGRAGLLGRARDRRPPDRDDVHDRRGPHRHRDDRAGRRAAAEGRDAVARTSHRRAVRAAGDHHARRGGHRHGRVDQRGRARLRGLDGRRRGRRLRRHRPHLCDVVDVLRDPVGGGAAAAPRAVVHVGVRPHRRLRRPGGDRRGPARRRLLPRARDDPRPDGHRAEHGDPGLDLRRRAVRHLRRVHPASRPVPPLAAGGVGRR